MKITHRSVVICDVWISKKCAWQPWIFRCDSILGVISFSWEFLFIFRDRREQPPAHKESSSVTFGRGQPTSHMHSHRISHIHLFIDVQSISLTDFTEMALKAFCKSKCFDSRNQIDDSLDIYLESPILLQLFKLGTSPHSKRYPETLKRWIETPNYEITTFEKIYEPAAHPILFAQLHGLLLTEVFSILVSMRVRSFPTFTGNCIWRKRRGEEGRRAENGFSSRIGGGENWALLAWHWWQWHCLWAQVSTLEGIRSRSYHQVARWNQYSISPPDC